MSLGLTTQEVSVVLNVTPETVRRYIRDGKLVASDRGGRLMVSLPVLVQFMREQESLGLSIFPTRELTERKLRDMQLEFTTLVIGIEQTPTESAQLRLFDLAWQILATQFNPVQEQFGKGARSLVLRTRGQVWGNPKFMALELAFQIFLTLEKEREKIPLPVR